MKLKSQKSKLLSLIITLSIILSIVVTFPLISYAQTESFTYDGFTVQYNITGGWANNQNISVTITNTGNTPIRNWALQYDFCGTINGIWNGEIFGDNVVKSVMHNSDIPVGSSVSFGYTLMNSTGMPNTFNLCNYRVEKEDGYTVALSTMNDWGSGFTGLITITNTTSKPIMAWKLAFNTNFIITHAETYMTLENTDMYYKITGLQYNGNIPANSSISLQFNASSASNAAISNVSLSEIVVSSVPIGGSETCEVCSVKPCSCETPNTCEVCSVVPCSCEAPNTCEVCNIEPCSCEAPNTCEICAVEPCACESLDTCNVCNEELCVCEIPDNLDEFKPEHYVPWLPRGINTLAAFGTYDEETSSIIIEWAYLNNKGDFKIYKLNNDKILIAELTDKRVYSFPVEEQKDEYKYVVEMLISDNEYLVSNDIIIRADEYGYYSFVFIDTDEDGYPDLYELIAGTDPLNPDTDGDGLPDGYEVYILSTDPLAVDTDNNGILDGDEDFDEDGLTNYEEYLLGTNPLNPDTDSDGLNDGEEISIYGTDPLKYDTDEDNIGDGDELKLGLDPLNPATFGYPDAEHIVAQEITADNEVFEYINNENEYYQVSIETSAGGWVESNLEVQETGYAAVMRNEAMLGIAPELVYDDVFAVESVTLKFEIADEYLENEFDLFDGDEEEFTGIKRLNIFKYFEDINVLLPVETKFDITNNILYTEVDEFGTYCIMDMEKWLVMLGAFDDETEPEDSDTQTYSGVAPMSFAPMSMYSEPNAPTGRNYQSIEMYSDEVFNVFFVIDTRDTGLSSRSNFNIVKDSVYESAQEIFEYTPNARIYLLEQNYNSKKITDNTNSSFYKPSGGGLYFTNASDIKTVLDRLTMRDSEFYSTCYLSDSINYIADICDGSLPSFVFTFFDKSKVYYRDLNGYSVIDKFEELKIDVIAVSDFFENDIVIQQMSGHQTFAQASFMSLGVEPMTMNNNFSRGEYSIKLTEGAEYPLRYGSNHGAIEYIFKENNQSKEFPVIMATGYQTIVLDNWITRGDNDTDTDRDGIPDWKEIDIDSPLFKVNITTGRVELPTINECRAHVSKPYVEQGLSRYEGDNPGYNGYYKVNNSPILPIKSNPADADSSNSGIPDLYNKTPLRRSGMLDVKDDLWGESNPERKLFYVLEDYSKPREGTISGNPRSSVDLRSTPNGKFLQSQAMFYPDNGIVNIKIYAIVQATSGDYWLKIATKNNVMGYIKYSDKIKINLQKTNINGKSIQEITTISKNDTFSAKGVENYYSFTPTISGVYTFYTTAQTPVGVNQSDLTDTRGWLYSNSSFTNLIADNDNIASGNITRAYTETMINNGWKNLNFSITTYLKANTTYYLKVGTDIATTYPCNYTLHIKSYASPLAVGYFYGSNEKDIISTNVSSGFNSYWIYSGKWDHPGIDIETGSQNLPLLAIADGIVKNVSDNNDANGYSVRIEYKTITGDYYTAIYLHLKEKSELEVDKPVKKGTIIGDTGGTAGTFNYGIHLHLSIRDKAGKYVDPLIHYKNTLLHKIFG